VDSNNLLKRLNDLSQRLANAMDLDEASAVAVDAPLELTNARGAALWLFDGAPLSSLAAVRGLDKNSLTALTRDQAQDGTLAVNGANWLVLPLRRNERLVGALTVSLASDAPSADQMELLHAWAHQASAVIESHRMRALETIAFREVDRGVRADLNVRELMERLLNQMISVCEAEGGTIYLYDAKQNQIEAWASVGLPTRVEFARAVILNRRPETMAEIVGNSDWAIGAPMMLGSRIEGAVVLTRSARIGAFLSRSIEILSTLSSSAALIVRNAELYARSEEAVIAEERARFASDIHDGLLQDLGFMAFKIAAAGKLLKRGKKAQANKELREVAQQLSVDALEVRRMVFALRPFAIEILGFIPAMEKYAKDFAQLHGLGVKMIVRGEQQRLSQKLEMALFRLIQEALNNIRKHAQARHVWVDLEFTGASVILSVRDDGRGFLVEDALKKAHARGSFGLAQMRERVERAGGKFQIETEQSRGTRLWMELPMR
jgi:signal transduction histidine kinase